MMEWIPCTECIYVNEDCVEARRADGCYCGEREEPLKETKLINCGNYNCMHHYTNSGTCSLCSISLDKDGKCVVFKEKSYKEIPIRYNEMDEHTNMY